MTEVKVVVVAPDPASGDLVLEAIRQHQDLAVEAAVHLDPAVLVLVNTSTQDPDARARVAKLSPRELQVLQSLVDGQSPNDSAAHLHIAVNTLRSHTKHILAKLGASSSLQAASVAVRAGLRPSGGALGALGRPEAGSDALGDDQAIIDLTAARSRGELLAAAPPDGRP